jgi:hypothetical protein
MAAASRTWGAERIRGELLKLHIHVAKATIQKYICGVCPPRRSGQSWATFLHNYAQSIWACDFLPVTDLLFRSIHAFFIMDLATRKIVHVGVGLLRRELRDQRAAVPLRSLSMCNPRKVSGTPLWTERKQASMIEVLTRPVSRGVGLGFSSRMQSTKVRIGSKTKPSR